MEKETLKVVLFEDDPDDAHLVGRHLYPRGDIPYYVVLDASGKVLKDHQGYMSGDVEELGAFLETVLPSG